MLLYNRTFYIILTFSSNWNIDINHTQFITKIFNLCSVQRLWKYVTYLFSCLHLTSRYQVFLNFLMDEVIINLDVFGSLMIHRIWGNVKDSLIIVPKFYDLIAFTSSLIVFIDSTFKFKTVKEVLNHPG